MQKLHLVGFTTDHKSLILSARRGARSGGFVLEVDDDVAAAVTAALEHAGEVEVEAAVEVEELAPPKPQSALSVKELQSRLRLGRSIESVAAEAGVDVEWVTRFAAPVLAEQIRVVDATRNATFHRARLGPSALKLGASVYRNLAAKGLDTPPDQLDKGWSTRQIAEGRWLVTFAYVSRSRKQQATWELDLRTGEVRATDRLGSDLAFVPGAPKPVAPTAASTKPVKVPASAPTDLDRANAKRVTEVRKAAEARLADAARRGTKQSVEVVKRAATPKAASQRAERAERAEAGQLAATEVPAAEPIVAEPAVAEAVAVDAPAVVAAEPPTAPALVTVDDLTSPWEPEPVWSAADEIPSVPTPRAPGTDLDPAASAVAMVREAAQTLLSDFAAGRLVDADLAAAEVLEVPTWEEPVAEVEAPVVEEPEVDEAWVEPEAEVVPAATPVPARRRRIAPKRVAPVVVEEPEPEPEPESEPEPVLEPAPVARPSRALRRAAEPVVAPVPDPVVEPVVEPDFFEPPVEEQAPRRRGRRGDKVVRTRLDLDDLPPLSPPPAPRSERRAGPTFRDDLVAPAASNGTGEHPAPAAAPAPVPGPPRRRRSEPLRAR